MTRDKINEAASKSLIESLRTRRPDPIADRLVITLDEMTLIANSIYTAESETRGQFGRVDFDFMDVEGNKYYCVVMVEEVEQMAEWYIYQIGKRLRGEPVYELLKDMETVLIGDSNEVEAMVLSKIQPGDKFLESRVTRLTYDELMAEMEKTERWIQSGSGY